MGCCGNSSYHKMDKRGSIGCEAYYSRINSTKFPDLGAAKVSEPRLVLQFGRVRGFLYAYNQCVAAIRAVGMTVFFCLRGSCSHLTEVEGPLGLLDTR